MISLGSRFSVCCIHFAVPSTWGFYMLTALLIMNDHKKEKQSKNNKAETVTGVLNCSGSWALAKGSFLTVRELHLVMHWSDEKKWVGPIEGWEKRGRRDAPWLVSVASKWCWLVCLWNWFLSRVIEAETKFSGMQPFPCILFKEKKRCGGGFCDEGNGTEKKLIGRRAKSENGKYKNSSQAPWLMSPSFSSASQLLDSLWPLPSLRARRRFFPLTLGWRGRGQNWRKFPWSCEARKDQGTHWVFIRRF